MSRSGKRFSRIRIIGILAVLLLTTIAFIPVTTSRAVDYVVSVQKITLYEKAIHFLSRDLNARRLAAEIVTGAAGEAQKVMRLRSWVRTHIRPVPEGWPVLDDHLWNVMVRGYGAYDQQAEVFALLASYVGIRSAPVTLRDPVSGRELLLVAVQSDKKILLMDLSRDLEFTNHQGEPAGIEELVEDPELIARAVGDLKLNEVPYARYLSDLAEQEISYERIERQRPWMRLKQELAGLFTLKEE